MTRSTLLKSIPIPIRKYIVQKRKMPSSAMLEEYGYKMEMDGMYKRVAIHDRHVLKSAHRPRPNSNMNMVDREIETYNELTPTQRKLVIPMFIVIPGISIAIRALVDDPELHEITIMDGIAILLGKVCKSMGFFWDDKHGGNIGFVDGRDWPVIIDLDFIKS